MQKKRLGQVFLQDPNILDKIFDSVSILPDDHVVEIGCGEGVLSERLASVVRHLTIIEIDPVYLEKTRNRLSSFSNVTYLCEDVLKTSFFQTHLGSVKIIANIPYYISTKILKLIIEYPQKIQMAYLMVQKEFAQKLIAKPNTDHYVSLTLYCAYYLHCHYLFTISKHSFKPVPKVDSAFISLQSRTAAPFSVDEAFFFAIVRSAFWGRRKTLLACLRESPYLNLDPCFKEIPFFKESPRIRGETMVLDQFYRIYLELLGRA